MKIYNSNINQMNSGSFSGYSMNEISSPHPHRSDPFRKEEDDNDYTRIKPGVTDPEKNDPTRIDIPGLPKVPSPGEDQPGKEASPAVR